MCGFTDIIGMCKDVELPAYLFSEINSSRRCLEKAVPNDSAAQHTLHAPPRDRRTD